MDKQSKIYVAGHKGLVGSAIQKTLLEKGYSNLVLRDHNSLDLTNQDQVKNFFEKENPEYVVLAAAKVGGIRANNICRADFIYQNLMIQSNVIHQSYLSRVKKLLFLGSTCIYPKNAMQPISENSLLTSELEYTNEPYAIAKIAGVKMCESYNLQYQTNFISVMPTNLYGPNDNFDLKTSHVLPALMRKIYLGSCLESDNWDAIRKDIDKNPIENINGSSNRSEILSKLNQHGVGVSEIEIWGTGNPRRDFLYSDDMADACVFLLENTDFRDTFDDNTDEIKNTHTNIGTGITVSIKELSEKIRNEIGYTGGFNFNILKPDGVMHKKTDVSKLTALGWTYKTTLEKGVKKMYSSYLSDLQ